MIDDVAIERENKYQYPETILNWGYQNRVNDKTNIARATFIKNPSFIEESLGRTIGPYLIA